MVKRILNTPRQHYRWKVGLLYFFLLTGGLWHILNILQNVMKITASPLIIGLGIWLILEVWRSQFNKGTVELASQKLAFIIWIVLVLFSTIFVEWIGVNTGKIFGEYQYSSILFPFIDTVPLAIGFAWLGMLLSAVTIAQFISFRWFQQSILYVIFMTAGLMILFDFFMEPAAIKLNYWYWINDIVPWQNYVAWFGISAILIFIGMKFKLFLQKNNAIPLHAYLAQLLYFLLVYFS
jgi:uncharacterized membrane protein